MPDAREYNPAFWVKYYRQHRGLTQKELADKSGVRITTIANIEQAKHGMTLMTAALIATALEVTLNQLVWGGCHAR